MVCYLCVYVYASVWMCKQHTYGRMLEDANYVELLEFPIP